jgi:hypothetical protein
MGGKELACSGGKFMGGKELLNSASLSGQFTSFAVIATPPSLLESKLIVYVPGQYPE